MNIPFSKLPAKPSCNTLLPSRCSLQSYPFSECFLFFFFSTQRLSRMEPRRAAARGHESPQLCRPSIIVLTDINSIRLWRSGRWDKLALGKSSVKCRHSACTATPACRERASWKVQKALPSNAQAQGKEKCDACICSMVKCSEAVTAARNKQLQPMSRKLCFGLPTLIKALCRVRSE